jgi:O-antigen/teichoic acid export membrane protein
MRTPQFLRHAVVYGFGTLVVNACGIFLLPLYLRYLPPDEYGTLDGLRTVGEVVLILLLFGGLKQALLTYHGQQCAEAERRRVVGSALALGGLVVFLGAAATLLGGAELGHLLDFSSPGLLEATLFVLLLEASSGLLMTSCQARVESGLFMAVSVGQFFVRVALSIAFVTGLGWGIRGMLAAAGLTAGGTTLLLLAREFALGGLTPDRATLRAMARFALPFVPGGLGFLLLHSGDKFFLMKYADKWALGLYALGYKLAFSVSQFSRSPLYMVWNTQMHQAAFRDDAPGVFGRAFSRILGAYLAVGLGLCLLADELAVMLGGPRYEGAAPVIPVVVLAYYCLTAADLMDSGFYVSRRTAWKAPITMASTVVILTLYALLIPGHGAFGAALATLGGFAFHAVLTWRVSQRVFPVDYEWGRTGAAFGLALAAWGLSRLVPAGPLAVSLKAALWPAWALTLWGTGIVSQAEKQQAREIVALAFERLRGRFGPRRGEAVGELHHGDGRRSVGSRAARGNRQLVREQAPPRGDDPGGAAEGPAGVEEPTESAA